MNKNLENTIANLTSHFEKDDSHYSYVAKLTGSPYQGYTARILTIQRNFYLTCYADETTHSLIYEISPSITCEKAYMPETAMLLCEINSTKLLTNYRLEKNGSILIHTEQRFVDAPVSVMTINRMESELMLTLKAEMEIIENVAHGKGKAKTIDFSRNDTDFEQKSDNGNSTMNTELALKLVSDHIDNILRAEGVDSDNIPDFKMVTEEFEESDIASPNNEEEDESELTDDEYKEIREMVSSIFGKPDE